MEQGMGYARLLKEVRGPVQGETLGYGAEIKPNTRS
jgi:hypothetical protein